MFSVEDLLISHGYKLPTNTPDPYENKSDGCHYEISQKRAGRETLNGYETDYGVHCLRNNSLVKGYCSDNEDKQGNQTRKSNTADITKDGGTAGSLLSSNVGSYGSVPLRGSSRQKTAKDIAHWRRRGQDFSVLLGYNEKGNTRTNQSSTTSSQGTHNSNYGSGTANENWPEVEGATENVMRKNGLGETSKASFSHKQRGFNTETWTDSTKSQNQASENKDSSSLESRRDALGSQYGKISSSLPRGFLSENMTHIGQPILSINNCLQGVKSVVPYPKNSIHLDLNPNSRTGNSFHNLPKPKYGRPDRPPTYQLHQQTRGTVETDRFQEEQSKAEQNQSTNISEPGNNVCIQESSIDPPVYVPPPSYKPPPGPNVSQILDCGMYFRDELQHQWERSNSLKEQLPFDNIGSDGQYRAKSCVSFENDGLNTDMRDYTSSVQYIPFDDPRIRHIKMGQEEGYTSNTKETENKGLTGFQCLQGKIMVEQSHARTRLDIQDSLSNVNYSSVMGNLANNKCLDTFTTSYKKHGVPDHADNATAGCEKDDLMYDKKDKHSQKKEDSHDTFENQNNWKTCEAETEIQCRISSRKKMNETIFCLVSVPVTAVLGQTDKDKNNNDFTQSKEKIVQVDDSSIIFHEQRFQSSLSTDLERQRPNKNRLEKEEHRPEEHKHTDDVKLSKPKKHKELRYSGSWPGDHCKDHQSEAIFPHEDRNSEYFCGANLSKQNDTNFGPNSAASLPVMRSKKQAGDYGQTAYSINGQRRFTPSVKSAFSRTISSETHLYKPKTYPNVASGLLSGSTNGKEKSIFTKPEVVKGDVVGSLNSKEPFGQFLLKPANRRPCDAISELEFLNKEFQERESDQNSNLLEKDKEQLHDWCSGEMLNSMTAQQSKKQTDYENKPEKKVQEIAVLQTGRVKSKSESWSNDVECDSSQIFSVLEFPFPGRSCTGQSSRSSEENALTKNDRGNKKADNNKNKDYVSSERQESTHRLFKSYSLNSGTKKQHPISTFCDTHEDQFYFDDALMSFKKESEKTVPENYDVIAKETDPRLISANRNQGLSESDRNGLRIDGNSESMCYTYHENQQTLDIPESESLQARASRILGIDVGEDSINDQARQSQYLSSEVSPPHQECFERERVSGTTETKEEPGQNALMEIENCDSNENSALNGELNILSKSCSSTCTLLKFSNSHDVSLSPENELVQLKLEKQEHDENTLSQSIPSSIIQKKAVTPSSEKKTRSTSKMIETLQEKLACTPQRTATDRLFRMTEVHSVSRMRRLSIKRSDSGDEADFEKEPHKSEEEEVSELTSVRNELSRKITTQSSAVSKRIISLETPNVSTKNTKTFEDDIFYIDSYDPTRVERV